MRSIMKALKLTVNEQKTGICTLPEGRFDFLGYTIERCYSPKTGKAYIGTRPSKKAIRHICRAISEATARRWLLKDHQERIAHLNRKLAGWGQLLPSWSGQQSLSECGQPHPETAPLVVVQQVPNTGKGKVTLP